MTTRDDGPGHFRDGRQMFAGRHYAWVSASQCDITERGVIRHVHAGRLSVTHPMPGKRRVTKFCLVSTYAYPPRDATIRSRAKAYALLSSLISDSERRKPESTVTS